VFLLVPAHSRTKGRKTVFVVVVVFGADLLKNVVTGTYKLPKLESAHLSNRQTTSGLSHKQ